MSRIVGRVGPLVLMFLLSVAPARGDALDLPAFENLLPDTLMKRLGLEPASLAERLPRFLERDEIAGEPLALGEGEEAEGVRFVAFHRRVPVNGFRYLPAEATLELDWEDPWFSQSRNRNLRRRYDSPGLDRIHFVRRTLRTTGVIDPPEDLPVLSATLGVIFVYPVKGLPQRATMTWDLFSERLAKIPVAPPLGVPVLTVILVLESQGGARVKVRGLELVDATTEAPEDGDGFRARCVWNVTGDVGHWGHIHQRRNGYEALLTVRPVGGVWKITQLDLLDEKRL